MVLDLIKEAINSIKQFRNIPEDHQYIDVIFPTPHDLRRTTATAMAELKQTDEVINESVDLVSFRSLTGSLTCPISSLYQKNNPRNINYMTAVIFLLCLDLDQNPTKSTDS